MPQQENGLREATKKLRRLPYRDMKTALFALVFHITAPLGAAITEHLAQHPLECVVAYSPALGSCRVIHGIITIVGNIESGAIAMTTLLAGIAIVSAQSLHVLLGSQHARYNDPVQRNTLHVQTVHECPAYVTEQQTGSGNQIRYALRHTGIYIIIGAHSHIHQFILSVLGLLPVANRRHAPLLCGHSLHEYTPVTRLYTRCVSMCGSVSDCKVSATGSTSSSRQHTAASSGTRPVTPGKAHLTTPKRATEAPKVLKNIFFFSLLINQATKLSKKVAKSK